VSKPIDQTIEARGPQSRRPGGETGVPLKLVVVGGADQGREVPFDESAVVGADPSCQLVLHDRSVSRKHVSIVRTRSRIEVKDLGSRNGTFFAGARLKEGEVPVGAVLTLGDTSVAIQPRWFVREVVASDAHAFGELLGDSLAMREIFAILERVAPTMVTILVEGESGTGKELAARSIHHGSPRAAEPYVVFDCASVPAELAESELFGHKKGAFSGATQDRAGAFQRAHGGTLCLDELGELPIDLQPKLLRALETSEIRAVGDDVPRKVDVRVVAATNRDLRAEAQRGRFRSDLLYRLEVVKIRIPPLRQRPEDIPGLVAAMLTGKIDGTASGDNLTRLMAYSWPGNVRELRNVLTRAVALAQVPGRPSPRFDDLAFNLGPAATGATTIGGDFPGVAVFAPFKEAKAQLLASFERAYVSKLLERHGNNVQQAAAAAGLSRKHLYNLMKAIDEGTPSGEDEG
jgi:DNA-binding NtrC family response regulator